MAETDVDDSMVARIKAAGSLLRGKREEALARTVKYLRAEHKNYEWVGIYLLRGDVLELAAWSGEHATSHVRIPVGRGICGLAARTKETVIVDDVSKDPRYLECFPSTKSEIVVPIMRGSEVLGEIDIDCSVHAAFNKTDRSFLEKVAAMIANIL